MEPYLSKLLSLLPPRMRGIVEQKAIWFRLSVAPRLVQALCALREHLPLTFLIAVALVLFSAYAFFYSAPGHFPVGSVVTIEPGATLRDVVNQLEEQDVVRSDLSLHMMVRFLGGEETVIAGDYFFSRPLSTRAVAKKIISGDFGLTPVRITIPEGATTLEIAELFTKKFGRFDPESFLTITKGKEGYLFPDTYFFLPNVRAREVARVMEETFYKKIDGKFEEELEEFGKPLEEVVTMASLLEKEARKTGTRRHIAGILWKRLAIDMPLQVDATFLYINGKNTYQLTLHDLANDSPYNTYAHKGLPPGPIANPGLGSLQAAITPIESNYLFYLADRYGNTYYAETFDGHKHNKRLYVY